MLFLQWIANKKQSYYNIRQVFWRSKMFTLGNRKLELNIKNSYSLILVTGRIFLKKMFMFGCIDKMNNSNLPRVLLMELLVDPNSNRLSKRIPR